MAGAGQQHERELLARAAVMLVIIDAILHCQVLPHLVPPAGMAAQHGRHTAAHPEVRDALAAHSVCQAPVAHILSGGLGLHCRGHIARSAAGAQAHIAALIDGAGKGGQQRERREM